MFGTRILAVVVVVAVMAVAVPAMGDITISYIGESVSGWYFKSDPAIAEFEVNWPPGERKHFYEEPGGPEDIRPVAPVGTNPCVDCTGEHPIRWRLELGAPEGIDWLQVRAKLKSDFGVCIGGCCCCRTVGWLKPIPGYSYKAELHTRYTREFYRIEQGFDAWVISVFKPCQGVCTVYTDVRCVGMAAGGTMDSFPSSDPGTCASWTLVPFVGDDCPLSLIPNGGKDNFKIEPTGGNVENATMGKVKSLYENK
jgi:hypothetical protein